MNETDFDKVVSAWLEKSEDDLATAKTLLENRRFNWSVFICQQALEKCLKAGYVKKNKEVPPYIHKLERLSILELDPPEEILNAIIEIDKYYLATRYPTYKEAVNIADETTAKLIFDHTKASYKWLRLALKL